MYMSMYVNVLFWPEKSDIMDNLAPRSIAQDGVCGARGAWLESRIVISSDFSLHTLCGARCYNVTGTHTETHNHIHIHVHEHVQPRQH